MNPFQTIATSIARREGVCPKDVLGRSKFNMHAHPRQEAMWVLNLRGHSTPKIGAWAGRDHTTVLWAAKAHQRRYELAHLEKWG